jgi:DNA anti-recombination protein RmuC
VALERLLQDALPRGAYDVQHRFDSTGAVVDAVVRSGDRMLSVDSKFPLEAYRRLVEGGDAARKEFSLAVRKHADSIAEKYILPHEHTFDFALMFVPSEGVYYELIMTEDAKSGQLDEYCRSKRVFPVSPNTFYACLSAVALSLQEAIRGLRRRVPETWKAFAERATELRRSGQPSEPHPQFAGTVGARRSPRPRSEGAGPHCGRKIVLSLQNFTAPEVSFGHY